MGLRFRRSVRLFPGVRLNFSGGGISTTIGVRGASVNIGPHGSYLNVGLPGSGLSYRTKISPDAQRPQSSIAPAPTPVAGNLAVDTHEIRSADVSVMTSPGLGELKKIINEASATRTRLVAEVAQRERTLARAKRKLFFAKMFVIRLFTKGMVPRLAAGAAQAEDELADASSRLEGCGVEIDFAFEEATIVSYAELIHAFNALRSCDVIWDITSTWRTDRAAERTTADYRVKRKAVQFDYSESELIRTKFRAIRLGNANGLDIHIYPGFIMMRDSGDDFALIEFRELDVGLASTNFLEEERVPGDSEVVGHTWKKANKDGSRDHRFNGNYQIPLARYGELTFRSPTGLLEAYMISNLGKTQAFASALRAYQKGLADLAARSKHAPAEIHQLPPPAASEPSRVDVVDIPAAAPPEPPKHMVLDWVGLIVIVLGIAAGSYWGVAHRGDIENSVASLTANVATPSSVAPKAAVVAPAPPEPAVEVAYVQKSGVNVRSEPSASAQIVGAEPKGRRFVVFRREGQWTQVGDTKPVGWVYSPLLGPKEP